MNVRIREVEKDDLKAVSDIIVRGWQTAYMGIVDDTFLDNLCVEKTYQRLLTNYKENGFIVAECENKIVGICRYRFGDFYKNQYDSVDYELCALYVKPELKRNVIGKCLVSYVMNDFKQNGCFKMILWCFKYNFPSRAFYESLRGFYCGENITVKGDQKYKEVGYVFDLN